MTTKTDLETLQKLTTALAGSRSDAPWAVAQVEINTIREAGLCGLMRRDLGAAMKKAGEPSLNVPKIECFTEQTDWRDNCGFLVADERAAAFVAQWVTKYLDPRDADGNKATPIPRSTITGRAGFFVGHTSHKIGD